MFLYSKFFNEGSSGPHTGDVKKDELHEGRNPKEKEIPNHATNKWAANKTDLLGNRRWEKLRNSL